MEATTSIGAPAAGGTEKPARRRLPASDERLVKRIRAGSDEAFAALYERYQGRLLSFCRHMLGSRAEAEDAVQQAFVNAYRDIVRDEKDLRVRPWLYRIARNQCLSVLRGRRFDVELDPDQVSLSGLGEQLAERADLRALLGDLARLPHEQREALVLAELNDNSHAEVAEILGCDREKVKALVFQARSSLIKSREARELPCADVQRQLSVLKGGSLRRSQLRRHLAECPACRAFREDVKRQRAALALVLPVVPSTSLKLGAPAVLAAAKAGTGAAATGAASSSVAAGSTATLAAKLGVSGSALKGAAAVVAVTAAVGGTAGVEVATRHDAGRAPGPPQRHADPRRPEAVPATGSRRPARPDERSRPLRAGGRAGREHSARAKPGHSRERTPRAAPARAGIGPQPGRGGARRGPAVPRHGTGQSAGRTGSGKLLRPERAGGERPGRTVRPARPHREVPSMADPTAADGDSLLPAG